MDEASGVQELATEDLVSGLRCCALCWDSTMTLWQWAKSLKKSCGMSASSASNFGLNGFRLQNRFDMLVWLPNFGLRLLSESLLCGAWLGFIC